MQIPMPVRKVVANKKVIDDRAGCNRAGPLYIYRIYRQWRNVFNKYVPANVKLTSEKRIFLAELSV